MENESQTGIHDVLLRIAKASRRGDSEELNAALFQLSLLAEGRFRAKIERRLASYAEYSRGYSVSLDDASDALNELLWVVCQKAETYRGATDAEADAWVNRIVERRLIDKGRAVKRRAAKWRDIFARVPERLKAFLETSDNEK